MIDANRVQGAAGVVGGRVRDAVGGLTGDVSTRRSGKMDQVIGKTQGAYGTRGFAEDNPLLAPMAALSVGLIMGLVAGRR